MTEYREKFLDSTDSAQFLRDVRAVTRRISHLIKHSKTEESIRAAIVELLQLVLSIEGAFSVWYRFQSQTNGKMDLKRWEEASVRDAERIAEQLRRLSGKEASQPELPSTRTLIASNPWLAGRTLWSERDAQRFALVCYERLVRFMEKHDPPTAKLLQEIAKGREERLAELTYR